jgi:hypothetical protein
VIGERIIERNIRGAVNEVGQQLLGIRISSVLVAENVQSLLDPDDNPLPEEERGLVSGGGQILERIRQGLIIEDLSLDAASDINEHGIFPLA